MCGLYGTNGKFNVTNGSSGLNRLYRTSGQREWGINWRYEHEIFHPQAVRRNLHRADGGGDIVLLVFEQHISAKILHFQ